MHTCGARLVFYMQADPEDNRDIALPSYKSGPLAPPARLPACTVDTMDVYVSRGEALHYDGTGGRRSVVVVLYGICFIRYMRFIILIVIVSPPLFPAL